MSIPRRDPNYTMSDLQGVGQKLLEAGMEYWEAAHKAGIDGAVIWVESDEGLVIFTRGEYRHDLLTNIEHTGPVRSFGASGNENDES